VLTIVVFGVVPLRAWDRDEASPAARRLRDRRARRLVAERVALWSLAAIGTSFISPRAIGVHFVLSLLGLAFGAQALALYPWGERPRPNQPADLGDMS